MQELRDVGNVFSLKLKLGLTLQQVQASDIIHASPPTLPPDSPSSQLTSGLRIPDVSLMCNRRKGLGYIPVSCPQTPV